MVKAFPEWVAGPHSSRVRSGSLRAHTAAPLSRQNGQRGIRPPHVPEPTGFSSSLSSAWKLMYPGDRERSGDSLRK